MTQVSGIYCRTNRRVSAFSQSLITEGFHHPDGARLSFDKLWLGTPRLYTDRDLSLTVTGDIELYNVSELAAMLDCKEDCRHPHGHERIIAKAYKRWGAGCVERFSGEFSFVVWDDHSQTMFCARDQIGHKPFYYYLDNSIFVFSTHIHFLQQFGFSANIDGEYVRGLLLKPTPVSVRSKTIHSAINKLSPAHSILVSEGRHEIKKYWDIHTRRSSHATSQIEAAETLSWYLERAVKQRLDVGGLNGVELSGGLDSSGVAAYGQKLLEQQNTSLVSLSNMLPYSHKTYYDGFRDESEMIELINRSLKINKQITLDQLSSSPFTALEKAVEYVGYPPSVTINVSQQPIYEAARQHQVSTLLSGFGGDEMVSANLSGTYSDLLLQSGQLSKASAHLRILGYSPVRSYAAVCKRFGKHLFGVKSRSSEFPAFDDVERGIFHEDFCKGKEKYDARAMSIAEWHQRRLKYPGFLERLETGYLITSHFGLKYKYPLLDVSLLEYFYDLPDIWKTNHRYGRALFRKALYGLLPEKVLQSNKARNTFVIPALKIEVELYFPLLQEWILSLSTDHRLFDYVDRRKIERLERNDSTEPIVYEAMRRAIMLAMFFNKSDRGALHEI